MHECGVANFSFRLEEEEEVLEEEERTNIKYALHTFYK